MSGSHEDTVDASVGLAPASASNETLLSDSIDLAATRGGGHDEVEFTRGDLIGRYVVIARLGAGAMGVVFAAYDPELDRKVALKLLRARGGRERGEAARARLQREAQALAKLNHPNVVSVHDVGVHESSVFVAMEFVDGRTLRQWCKAEAPSWQRVVEVLAAAGDGLSAAHESGLIHRDFKPDNVMIGDDGRVRVMDFGLARSGDADPTTPLPPQELEESRPSSFDQSLTRTGAVVGTPAYMAPEQFSGLLVTPHSDQFSFCVTLYEALYGERPFAGASFAALAYAVTRGEVSAPSSGRDLPSWLRQAVLTGLERDPSRRHRDMATLCAILRSGEARRKRRRTLWGAAALGAGALGLLGLDALHDAKMERECTSASQSIRASWNPRRRDELRAAFERTQVGYSSTVADKVLPWLDRNAASWENATLQSCRSDHVLDTTDTRMQARAHWCLEQRRIEFESVLDSFSQADEATLRNAVVTVAALRDASPCIDEGQLARSGDPPAVELRPEIAELGRALARASKLPVESKYDEALSAVQKVRERAQTLQWRPLIARASAREAELLYAKGEYEKSEAVGVDAYLQAARWNSWEVAADAAIALTYNVGYEQTREREGLLWAEHARVALAHAGDPLELGEARRLSNLASAMQTAGKVEESLALVDRALAIFVKALPPGHPDIAMEMNNRAFLLSLARRHDEARVLHEEAARIFESTFGPMHPHVAMSLNNLAYTLDEQGQHERALELMQRALEIRRSVWGPDHPKVAEMYNNIATTYRTLGRLEAARTNYEQALRIKEAALGPDAVDLAIPINNLASVLRKLGDFEGAESLYLRALKIREQALGLEHQQVGNTLNNLAMLYYVQEDFERSRELYERATGVWAASLGDEHPRVAHGQTGWGKALAELGRYGDALPLLEEALRRREANPRVPKAHLADTRFALARALWEAPPRLGRDRARALELARSAQVGFEDLAAGERHKYDEVLSWLAAR